MYFSKLDVKIYVFTALFWSNIRVRAVILLTFLYLISLVVRTILYYILTPIIAYARSSYITHLLELFSPKGPTCISFTYLTNESNLSTHNDRSREERRQLRWSKKRPSALPLTPHLFSLMADLFWNYHHMWYGLVATAQFLMKVLNEWDNNWHWFYFCVLGPWMHSRLWEKERERKGKLKKKIGDRKGGWRRRGESKGKGRKGEVFFRKNRGSGMD